MRKTKLTVKPTTAFKKDYKLAIKRGLQIELLETVIETLAMGNTLPPENRDHDLTGNWRGHRECHIQPDWLLIYRVEGDVLVLTLSRTGSIAICSGNEHCAAWGKPVRHFAFLEFCLMLPSVFRLLRLYRHLIVALHGHQLMQPVAFSR